MGFPVLTGNSGAVWSACQGQSEIPAPSRRLALNHIYSSINKGHVKLLNNVVCVGLRNLVMKVPVWILRCSGYTGEASLLKWKPFRKDESESTLGSYLEPLCLVGDTSEVPDPLTWDKVVNLILRLVGNPYLFGLMD